MTSSRDRSNQLECLAAGERWQPCRTKPGSVLTVSSRSGQQRCGASRLWHAGTEPPATPSKKRQRGAGGSTTATRSPLKEHRCCDPTACS